MSVCEGHHHILSRQWSIQHRADWLQSLRSWSVQCGPWGHSKRMCCTVCLGCPHGHSLLVSRPRLWRLLAVLPTPALALFRAAQSFLGRSVPVGSCSAGAWRASFGGEQSHSFHLSRRRLVGCFGGRLSSVMKLCLDFSLLCGQLWP